MFGMKERIISIYGRSCGFNIDQRDVAGHRLRDKVYLSIHRVLYAWVRFRIRLQSTPLSTRSSKTNREMVGTFVFEPAV